MRSSGGSMRTLRCGVNKNRRSACAMPGGPMKVNVQSHFPVRNISLAMLNSHAQLGDRDAIVYSYVVRSIDVKDDGSMVQTGCGPNFDGRVITLCTCMHQMRSGRTAEQWQGLWIAGFTSSTEKFLGHNWLVYLMQVGEAYPSHRDLVTAFRKNGRNSSLRAKAADASPIGDIYIPKSECRNPYDPYQYRLPIADHIHKKDGRWERDICYSRWSRYAALLVGDVRHSYRWNKMMIKRDDRLSRGTPKSTLDAFLQSLKSRKL